MKAPVGRSLAVAATVAIAACAGAAVDAQAAGSGAIRGCVAPGDSGQLYILGPHGGCPLHPAVHLSWSRSGARGERGQRGLTGDTGPAGSQGPRGPQGTTGDTGPQGTPGPTGNPGPAGGVGNRGNAGATGSAGAVGAAGAPGSSGPAGDSGQPGAAGPAGAAGATGAAGNSGIDNYSVQVGAESVTTTVGQGESFIITASCPAGTQLLGGGATSVSQEVDMVSSAPLVSNGQPTSTWTALFKVKGENAQGDTFQIDAVAYCGNIAS